MVTITPENIRLREAVTERVNAHDLIGVMDHGAPEDEYAPEAEDFARRIVAGTPVTPEVVATVWHHWLGDPSEEPQLTSNMEALAADLEYIRRSFDKR